MWSKRQKKCSTIALIFKNYSMNNIIFPMWFLLYGYKKPINQKSKVKTITQQFYIKSLVFYHTFNYKSFHASLNLFYVNYTLTFKLHMTTIQIKHSKYLTL